MTKKYTGLRTRRDFRDRAAEMRCVVLIDPDGDRTVIGQTPTRSIRSLQAVLASDYAQEIVKTIPGIAEVRYWTSKDRLEFENGFRVGWGRKKELDAVPDEIRARFEANEAYVPQAVTPDRGER